MANVEEMKVQTHLNTQLLQATITKIDRLESRPAPGAEEPDTTLQLDVCFPLGKQEDIQKLEDLLQSKNTCKTLVRSLSTIGGENTKSSVRRLLSDMITTKLAININWMGKGGKIAFSSLKLQEILKETVRKNRLCANATDLDVEIFNVAKDWFRFACDRDGGRRRRTEEKKLQIQIQAEQNESELEDETNK